LAEAIRIMDEMKALAVQTHTDGAVVRRDVSDRRPDEGR
jgi:hypothetical protein